MKINFLLFIENFIGSTVMKNNLKDLKAELEFYKKEREYYCNLYRSIVHFKKVVLQVIRNNQISQEEKKEKILKAFLENTKRQHLVLKERLL